MGCFTCLSSDSTTGSPSVRFGTKWLSITSTWSQSAEESLRHSSASTAKSLVKILGDICISTMAGYSGHPAIAGRSAFGVARQVSPLVPGFHNPEPGSAVSLQKSKIHTVGVMPMGPKSQCQARACIRHLGQELGGSQLSKIMVRRQRLCHNLIGLTNIR